MPISIPTKSGNAFSISKFEWKGNGKYQNNNYLNQRIMKMKWWGAKEHTLSVFPISRFNSNESN